MHLSTKYTDKDGHEVELHGDAADAFAVAKAVEDMANQMPEDYAGPRLTVFDETGIVMGWINGRGHFRAL